MLKLNNKIIKKIENQSCLKNLFRIVNEYVNNPTATSISVKSVCYIQVITSFIN